MAQHRTAVRYLEAEYTCAVDADARARGLCKGEESIYGPYEFGTLDTDGRGGRKRELGMLGTWRHINTAISNTSAMPQILGLTVRAAMVTAPLLIVLALLPMVPWTINGRLMSGQEAWASGFAPLLIIWLLLIAFAAWGIALRKSQSRWVAVVVPLVSGLLAANAASVSLVDLAISAAMALFIYLYLLRAPSVQRYFLGDAKK
jgi:hypothetical protein